ncbi:hypothetical protein E4U35_003801 [Claviceps purpurea]|nr:hypothetical protein E4U35_003801 [Claviceps purpurea]
MSPMPTFAKKTTWSLGRHHFGRGRFWSRKILVAGNRLMPWNAPLSTMSIVDHQAPQTLRQPLPSGSKAGAMSRDLDM